jgi:hypothetical protein
MMDLVHSHRLPRLLDLQKEKKWNQKEGMEVSDRVGKRVGILGYGSIGRQGECTHLLHCILPAPGRSGKIPSGLCANLAVIKFLGRTQTNARLDRTTVYKQATQVHHHIASEHHPGRITSISRILCRLAPPTSGTDRNPATPREPGSQPSTSRNIFYAGPRILQSDTCNVRNPSPTPHCQPRHLYVPSKRVSFLLRNVADTGLQSRLFATFLCILRAPF